MRTTLTIEDDVAARLTRLQRKRKASFKAIVNELLRAGLERVERTPSRPARPYRIEPVSLGSRVAQVDNIAEVLASYEGEGHR